MNVRERILDNHPRLRDTRDGFLLWRQATTLPDAADLVARWLRQDLRWLPWDAPTPARETLDADGFADTLARLNDAGILTIASQPGRPGRREYVTLVAPADLVPLVARAAASDNLFCETAPSKRLPRRHQTRVVRGGWPRAWWRLRDTQDSISALVGMGAPAVGSSIKRGECVALTVLDGEFGVRGRVEGLVDLLILLVSEEGEAGA